jgi:putative heme iron utilization protein
MERGTAADTADAARRLMRGLDRAALATVREGMPYASLVLVALDHDAAPLLLLSDLAEHTRNLKREPRAALLFDGTAGLADPLTGPRLTVTGAVERRDDPRLKDRFLGRHPAAATYAGFADFHLYRLAPARAHFVAGFGRIDWIEGADLACPAPAPLIAAEPALLGEANERYGAAIGRYAAGALGGAATGWRLTGIDPEGADLRREGVVARLAFAARASDAEAARAALAALLGGAREQQAVME